MLPLRDENPHPPGFKPKVTYALIIINVIVFFGEVVYTGQFIEFTNQNAFNLFYNWGAVPNCITGGSTLNLDFGGGPINVHYSFMEVLCILVVTCCFCGFLGITLS